jgi:hypothetical protein
MKKSVKLDIPKQFSLFCEQLDVSPQEAIQGFIFDVCRSNSDNGSNEREMSVDYFLRCGNGMPFFDDDADYDDVE